MEPQPETATVLVCGTAIPVTAEELELAADVFSFAIVLWEMLAWHRVRLGFGDATLQTVWVTEDGEELRGENGMPGTLPEDGVPEEAYQREDMRSVTVWMMKGARPKAEGQSQWPTGLLLLIQACWAQEPGDRLDSMAFLNGSLDTLTMNLYEKGKGTHKFTHSIEHYDKPGHLEMLLSSTISPLNLNLDYSKHECCNSHQAPTPKRFYCVNTSSTTPQSDLNFSASNSHNNKG